MLLTTIRTENNWQICPCPGDGHYLLHSYYHHIILFPDVKQPSVKSLKNAIESHVINNTEDYVIYGLPSSPLPFES